MISLSAAGGHTHALASSGQAWPIQSYQPQQYNPYQHWGMHGGANHARSQSGGTPPVSKSNKQSTRAPSNSNTHTGSKRSSKSSKRPSKSSKSGKSSAGSAKGEGVQRSSSDEMFAGGAQVQANKKETGKKVTTATLQKGQTAAISRVLNDQEEEEVPAAGSCLGQFWGTNRRVKKKKEMPRAPQITAPVVQSGGEGTGVRLGCW